MDTGVHTVRASKRDLRTLEPSRAIAFALLFAFLLFLSLDTFEAAVTNQTQLTWSRLLQFLRGFVSMAFGMLFVYATMHRKEQELIRLRDHFAKQVADRTEEITSLRSDFLAVISHRLHTPILANERAAVLMKQGAFGAVTDQQSEILQHLIDNDADIKRLLGMLVDIYRYKNGSKYLQRQQCSLDDLLRSGAEAAVSAARSKNIDLTIKTANAAVMGDQKELHKLIYHVLENAVKYARTKVEVDARTDDQGNVVVSITDDGAGMPPDDVANLFDRFYQMSTDGKYAPTTGIGLCLCAEIAAAHGGKIACRSSLNQSTTFSIRLPLFRG